MINTLIHIIAIVMRAHAMWPETPMDRVFATTIDAVAVETAALPAEALVAIAQHESDMRPNAVSYVVRGQRVDVLWNDGPLPRRVTCGYLQSMERGYDCEVLIALDNTMGRGVDELGEWVRTCRGDLACVFRGHAGGNACERNRDACSPDQRAFADLFMRNTRRLGWRRRVPTS